MELGVLHSFKRDCIYSNRITNFHPEVPNSPDWIGHSLCFSLVPSLPVNSLSCHFRDAQARHHL